MSMTLTGCWVCRREIPEPEDCCPAPEPLDEREFWEAPLRHFTPAQMARIEAGVQASEDYQADYERRRREIY